MFWHTKKFSSRGSCFYETMGRTYDRTHLQSASNPNYNFFVDVNFSDDDLRMYLEAAQFEYSDL